MMVRFFAIVLAIMAVHFVAADRCMSYALLPTAGLCAGKQVMYQTCMEIPDSVTDAQIESMKGTYLTAFVDGFNAKTLETSGLAPLCVKANRDNGCNLITAGANGTDACGAMACLGMSECSTGLNPPRSCLNLVAERWPVTSLRWMDQGSP